MAKTPERPPWFTEEIGTIPDSSRQFLEQYCGIPPDQVIPHVKHLRDKAFEIFPYPCIGQLRFLTLNLAAQPRYAEIVRRVKAGQKLLDVGCCFGQDMRKLIVDGAPAENLFGLDKERGFIDLGYDLFGDRGTLRSHMVVADAADATADLSALEGKIDIIFLSSFLHLWDWKGQVTVAKRLVALCAPKKGTLLVGRQLGTTVPVEFPLQSPTQLTFRHNVDSFTELWKVVGEETGTRWQVEASLYMGPEVSKNKNQDWADPNMRMMQFSVVRD